MTAVPAGRGLSSSALTRAMAIFFVLNAFVLTGIAIGLVMEDRRILGEAAPPA